MNFVSISFLIFFAIVFALHFLLPPRFRWMLLLAASYYFYMCWSVKYSLLLLFTTLLDYRVALGLGRSADPRARKAWLALSLASNLGVLMLFKYYDFFRASVNPLLGRFNLFVEFPDLRLLLPVGISFYTFQSLSYTLDVYRGGIQPERHFGKFALFVSFFPQLVAGPIERAAHLLPQYGRRVDFDAGRVTSGMTLVLWGIFKKVLIADRLAVYVNEVYNHPAAWGGLPVLLATYFFAFQIYCDFSAYSDIARGTARMLGFELMVNFDRPYASASVGEFWRRWHISLSTWFRDYVYIPLGGGRGGFWRTQFNLLCVFLLSGLWHGANWTFVIWGALNGVFLVTGNLTAPLRAAAARGLGLARVPRLHQALRVLVTFHLILFSWTFFRANSLGDWELIMRGLARFASWDPYLAGKFGRFDLVVVLAAAAVMESVQFLLSRPGSPGRAARLPAAVRWACLLGLSLAILNLGTTEEVPFIYFQF